MKGATSHIVLLVSAILAFLPVFAVDHVLDGYVRARETARLQRATDALTADTQAGVYDAITALRHVVENSVSLCTPTFIENVHRQMQQSIYLRQVIVENADGVPYCDAYSGEMRYTALSPNVSIPGHPEQLALVRIEGLSQPMFKVSLIVSPTRVAAALVHPSPALAQGMPSDFDPASTLRLTLTSGTEIMSLGDVNSFDLRTRDNAFIVVNSFAGELPLRAEATLPFAVARAAYTDLDVAFTLIACVMSAGILVLSLRYARRAQIPAFDLERAIVVGELQPYYQPIIDISTGKLAGCEVLIRWVRRNGDIILPGDFIDYAERTGLAIPMTLSLMQQVKADLGDLAAALPGMHIAINLFEGHFRDGTIVEDVMSIFEGSQISFRQLVFEITERHPLGNGLQAKAVIGGLHALGCRLALDDTGTGHSNLAVLQTIGVDIIKIDRVFVEMVTDAETPAPVLDGLIQMGRQLGTQIIAEGVEREEQAVYLRKHGVHYVQGFLFARALRASALYELAGALNGAKFRRRAGDRSLTQSAA